MSKGKTAKKIISYGIIIFSIFLIILSVFFYFLYEPKSKSTNLMVEDKSSLYVGSDSIVYDNYGNAHDVILEYKIPDLDLKEINLNENKDETIKLNGFDDDIKFVNFKNIFEQNGKELKDFFEDEDIKDIQISIKIKELDIYSNMMNISEPGLYLYKTPIESGENISVKHGIIYKN